MLLVQKIGAWCKCWPKTLVRSKCFVRSNYWSKYLSNPTIDPKYSSGPNIDLNICQVHPGQIHPGLLPSETVELGSNQKKMCETPGCIGNNSLFALTSFWNLRIGSIYFPERLEKDRTSWKLSSNFTILCIQTICIRCFSHALGQHGPECEPLWWLLPGGQRLNYPSCSM